jgi:hypothetical protein
VSNFDYLIERCRQWREEALKELRDTETGPPWFRDGVDVTEAQIAKAKQIVERMDKLIAAYEHYNTNAT